MPVTIHPLIALAAACLGQCLPAQDPIPVAYPQRDALSPFRNPTDVYAPPDELFRQLRIMQNISNRTDAKKSFGSDGREVIDDPAWRQARDKALQIGIDAGQLAQMMRLHRNGMQRDTAFYAAFYVTNLSYVMDLISHIPGEPQRRTREAAFPRAIEFLRVHLTRRFGDLTDDEQKAVLGALPEIGSPAAKAQGLTRKPTNADYLHGLRMMPFFQLLDVEDTSDQAQALWFLKEVFKIRFDLANLWLEPALPRIRQLLLSDSESVRQEAIAIHRLIGGEKLGPVPTDSRELIVWAKQAAKNLFPPIRNLNDAIVQLYPSKEVDAIIDAGIKALENSAIGDPFRGQKKDGSWYSGFRVGRVPDELAVLAIPADCVITNINGSPVATAQSLLKIVKKQVQGQRPRRLIVEYVHKGQSHAVEFRIM